MLSYSYPKVFSKQGREELGELVAYHRSIFSTLHVYAKNSSSCYTLSFIEYLNPLGIVSNYVLGVLLSLIPHNDIKVFAKELKTAIQLSKKNITTGSAEGFTEFKKDRHSKNEAVSHYIKWFERNFKLELKMK